MITNCLHSVPVSCSSPLFTKLWGGAYSAAAHGHVPDGRQAVISLSEVSKGTGGNGLPLACVRAAMLQHGLSPGLPPQCVLLQMNY